MAAEIRYTIAFHELLEDGILITHYFLPSRKGDGGEWRDNPNDWWTPETLTEDVIHSALVQLGEWESSPSLEITMQAI